MIGAWWGTYHGHRALSDEGHEKDRYRRRDWPEEYTEIPVSERETRAGQYMRRLRRIAARAKDLRRREE